MRTWILGSYDRAKIKTPLNLGDLKVLEIISLSRKRDYTIPCANIASATFTKPAIFAPFT